MTDQAKDDRAEVAAERQAQADAFHEANSNCFTEFESFDSGWKAGVAYARAAISSGGKGEAVISRPDWLRIFATHFEVTSSWDDGTPRRVHCDGYSFDEFRREIESLYAALQADRGNGESVAGCNMGVGCDEAGVCYAMAHGQPERCAAPQAECAASDASAQPVAEVIKWKTFTGHTAWDFKVFDQTIEHGTKLYTRPAPSDAQAECDKGAA